MRRSPVRQETGSRILRSAGFLVALSFRILPKSLRFRAAVVVARLLEPLLARTRGWQRRAALRTDTLRETTLEIVLLMFSRYGTTYDPILHIEGLEHLEATRGCPTLLVGPHTMLSYLFVRHLHDHGFEISVIAADPFIISGTRVQAHVLLPSPKILLQARSVFERRKMVGTMIDRADPERRNEVIDTAAGPMRISHALVRVALRSGAKMLFISTRLDEQSRIRMTLAVPRPHSTTAADVVEDFAAFAAATLPRAQAPVDGCYPSPVSQMKVPTYE